MASKNRTTLKGYFETGDTPSQAQYADLIDSNLNLSETTDQTTAGGLNITGNVTSSGNISASGGIEATSFQGTFGSSGVDWNARGASYTFAGGTHITASGNISASGDLYANKYHSNGYNLLRYKANEDRTIVGSKFKTTHITGSSLALGDTSEFHVTASGNISASGNVIANEITVNTLSSTNVNTTHVTASGNISSSGTITGNNLLIDGSQVDFTNLPTSDPGVAGRLFSNNIYVKISQG